MPNWVFNGLTIEGKPESITKLVEQMNTPFTRVHDNWNTTTGQMEKQLTTYSNPVFAFWNIIKPTDIEAYQNQPNYKPNASIEDMMKHDGDDWYSWNNRNWGVKWDVAVSDEDESPETHMEGPIQNGENLVVYYNFNTAWGLAMPALINLSSQYPDLLLALSYEEETCWLAGLNNHKKRRGTVENRRTAKVCFTTHTLSIHQLEQVLLGITQNLIPEVLLRSF